MCTDGPPQRVALWLAGAILAPAFASAPSALALSTVALLAFVLILFAVKGGARAALAGGASTALGAIFLLFTQHAIEHCAQFNRQPGGSCSMGDSTPFVLIAALYVAVGLALSYVAATRPGASARSA